jgi:hypothetical protein
MGWLEKGEQEQAISPGCWMRRAFQLNAKDSLFVFASPGFIWKFRVK